MIIFKTLIYLHNVCTNGYNPFARNLNHRRFMASIVSLPLTNSKSKNCRNINEVYTKLEENGKRSPNRVATRWKKIAYSKKHGKWSKEEDLALRELLKKRKSELAFLYPESTGNKRQNIVKRENETNDMRKNHRSGDNIRNLATQKGIKLPRIHWSHQEKEALRKAYLKFGKNWQNISNALVTRTPAK
ncbi:hypothetical protein G9A89_003951 [Geosiphon pyriformis]|nr:hypothetical protein G9A89_003951 [Geosiphon pyriformis]